jgi:hypothetical protein
MPERKSLTEMQINVVAIDGQSIHHYANCLLAMHQNPSK